MAYVHIILDGENMVRGPRERYQRSALGKLESQKRWHDRMRINDTTLTQAIGAKSSRKGFSAYCCPPKRLVCHHQWFLTRYPAGVRHNALRGRHRHPRRAESTRLDLSEMTISHEARTVFLQEKGFRLPCDRPVCVSEARLGVNLRQDAMHAGCTVEQGTRV
jgi:hypothetical protein